MVTEIYVISGFLGAGKTTLIRKLLRETFKQDKVVLIENDFGEISVDAALLKSGGVKVKEINSGCICCSLAGDFVKAVGEIVAGLQPDKIIIEPSGVGKLSDIMKACADPRIRSLVKVNRKITVADVKRCQMYHDNFGEFFTDQIQHADVILLSRSEAFPDKVNEARRLMESINAHSLILARPWSEISGDELLFPRPDPFKLVKHSAPSLECGCRRHDAADHDHSGCGHNHSHNHSAEDSFNTVTIRTRRIFSKADLRTRIAGMERQAQGTVLRAKGILRGTKGYVDLQYLPGDLKLTSSAAAGNMLCIIGRDLNRQELVSLFSGE